MKHSIVYAEAGIYAGWPANHGAWQWGDEFLFGFLRGKFSRKGDMHAIVEPYEKVLARSLDGGESWNIEIPNADFEAVYALTPPKFDLQKSIIRVCGAYDHGGEYCQGTGGFYLSHDRGKTWAGAFFFAGITDRFNDSVIGTARTAVLPSHNLIFLSEGNADIWGTDFTYCVRHDGERFEFASVVCEDEARAVMPAVAEVDGRIVVCLRRRKRGKREGWIDAYVSDDGGETFKFLAYVGSTGGYNGNPPALLALPDGRLLCAFGHRDANAMIYAISNDRGETWENDAFRTNEIDNSDIGYPRLFLRSDGTPVCVYYWVNLQNNKCQHIAMTELVV